MMFTKRLREGVRRGEIMCSVRFWMRPHVRVGARYPMGDGAIEIDSIETIGFPDITPELARESGFLGVLDLLKVAKHGRSEKIYLVRFHYVRPRGKRVGSGRPRNYNALRADEKGSGNVNDRTLKVTRDAAPGRSA